MGKETAIEWTHHTFNPWWGCVKVSPGCAHCYAETFSKRTGNAVWGMQAERRFFGEKHWNEPLKWNAAAQAEGQRKRVFCASMADVFEDRSDLVDARQRLIQLIDDTPWLDWLLLTKRPENIEPFLNLASKGSYARGDWNLRDHMKNVWLGTSAEDQERWDMRLPILMGIPAVVHFVSAEPLLGEIEMGIWRPEWLIVGGESGPKARPMERAWVESLRDQCDERTAFLFKQWGGVRKETTGRELDGRTWDGYPSPGNDEMMDRMGEKKL
jgi:protein gp37